MMSSSSGNRRFKRAQWPAKRAILLSIATTMLLGSAPAPVSAVQTARCDIPVSETTAPLPTPTQDSAPTPVGAAIIQVEGQAATPAAAATPVAPTPDPVETLTQELTAVSEALAACLSEGDVETVVELAGERYLGQIFGGSVPLPAEEYVALASQLTPISTRIVSVEEAAATGEDRATAVVTQVVANQLIRAEWTFSRVDESDRAEGESRWRLEGERQRDPQAPSGAAPLGVEIGDRSFELSANDVAGPDVVLRGINVADEDHEMLVLRLAPGYTTADLLRATGPDLPQEVTFVGERPVPAGAQADLVLVDLEPGDYTLVCLFTNAEGLPHLAEGMTAEFTVG